MLTETTTREGYIAEIERDHGKEPRNFAIAAHLRKLKSMTDADWIGHRDGILARRAQIQIAAKQMADDLIASGQVIIKSRN